MTKPELQQLVIDYANGYGIDPQIALAQAQRESGFNAGAVGSSGERGLMQIMPGTWQRFSQGVGFDQAFDPEYNLTTWGNYMVWLLSRYGWDYQKALEGYNGGEGHVDRGDVSQAAQNYAVSILNNAGAGLSVADSSGGAIETDQASSGITPVLMILFAAFGAALIFRK